MNLHPNYLERADFIKAYKLADKLQNKDFNTIYYIQGTTRDIDFHELTEEKEGRLLKKKVEIRRERDLRKN